MVVSAPSVCAVAVGREQQRHVLVLLALVDREARPTTSGKKALRPVRVKYAAVSNVRR